MASTRLIRKVYPVVGIVPTVSRINLFQPSQTATKHNMHHSLPQSPEPAPDQGDSLRIAETFSSIQGEGKLTGVPSFFIRTSGCNLRCSWCDTPYASWQPEGPVRTIEDIVDEARNSPARHAVITGGEPMLPPAITPLSHALKDAGFHITIETAGTIVRPVACDLISISPKLANSTPADDPRDQAGTWAKRHETRRLNPDALRALWQGDNDRQCKFVVTSPDDLAEIQAVIKMLDQGAQTPSRPDDILLMPEGIAEPTKAARDAVQRICMDTGYRYCTRLHIHLYGDARGT